MTHPRNTEHQQVLWYLADIFPAVARAQLQLGRVGAERLEEMKEFKEKKRISRGEVRVVCGLVGEQAARKRWHYRLL